MLQKIGNNGKPGRSFRGALDYIFREGVYAKLREQENGTPEWIGGNMAYANPRDLSRQFKVCRQARPDIIDPVFHTTLNLPPSETLDRNQWQEAVKDYLKELGFTENHPYTIVRHHDKEHEHVHIIASRVSYDGKVNKLSYSKQKGANACRKLEKKFGLTQIPVTLDENEKQILPFKAVEKKTPSRAEREKAERLYKQGKTADSLTPRERLQGIIDGTFKKKSPITFDDFCAELNAQNVAVKAMIQNDKDGKKVLKGLKYTLTDEIVTDRKTGEKAPLAFKASSLGTDYKVGALFKRGLRFGEAAERLKEYEQQKQQAPKTPAPPMPARAAREQHRNTPSLSSLTDELIFKYASPEFKRFWYLLKKILKLLEVNEQTKKTFQQFTWFLPQIPVKALEKIAEKSAAAKSATAENTQTASAARTITDPDEIAFLEMQNQEPPPDLDFYEPDPAEIEHYESQQAEWEAMQALIYESDNEPTEPAQTPAPQEPPKVDAARAARIESQVEQIIAQSQAPQEPPKVDAAREFNFESLQAEPPELSPDFAFGEHEPTTPAPPEKAAAQGVENLPKSTVDEPKFRITLSFGDEPAEPTQKPSAPDSDSVVFNNEKAPEPTPAQAQAPGADVEKEPEPPAKPALDLDEIKAAYIAAKECGNDTKAEKILKPLDDEIKNAKEKGDSEQAKNLNETKKAIEKAGESAFENMLNKKAENGEPLIVSYKKLTEKEREFLETQGAILILQEPQDATGDQEKDQRNQENQLFALVRNLEKIAENNPDSPMILIGDGGENLRKTNKGIASLEDRALSKNAILRTNSADFAENPAKIWEKASLILKSHKATQQAIAEVDAAIAARQQEKAEQKQLAKEREQQRANTPPKKSRSR